MRLAQMQKNVFELVSFLPFNINEKKKQQNEAKKSMTKRESLKSSFLRVMQFQRELV